MRLLIISIAMILGLSACESTPQRDSEHEGLIDIIPTKEKDSGPDKHIDVSHIPDAVPRYERRTIAGNKSPYKVSGVVYHVMEDVDAYQEEGIASWYGRKFHGNTTSNGEIYDMYAMTAAHKTLPIPAYAKVENLENKRSIIVRINDRGPFAPGRIIDLSYAGAQKLGYLDAGTARVRVTYIDVPAEDPVPPAMLAAGSAPQVATTKEEPGTEDTNTESAIYLQTGAFSQRDLALQEKLAVEQYTAWPVEVESVLNLENRYIHRVHIGPLPNQETLETLLRALVSKGLREPVRILK